MNYSEYQSSKKLRDIVKNYWRFEVADNNEIGFPFKHETLPHCEISIVFINQPYFEGIRIQGPHTNKFQKTIYPDSSYFGIRLMPWLTLTPAIINKQEILNTTSTCPAEISKHLESIKFDKSVEPAQLILQIEERLSRLFAENIQISQNDLVKYICLELSNGQSVGATIANVPMSIRVIQKLFKEVVGMSMRKYHNINRQGRLWVDFAKNKNNKSDLLFECGFYDQAHFINDFKKLMNRSPVDFEKRLQQINISLT